MSVTAAVLEQPNAPFELQELDLGVLHADEVLVDIAAVGLCRTDLGVRAGDFPTRFPVVLGHEGAGTVAVIGSAVTNVAVGDRVALSFNSCGACPTCATGRPAYCHQFLQRNFLASRPDGSSALSRGGRRVHSHFFGQSAFATQAVAPARSAVKVAGDVPFELLAPLGCGVQTGAGTVINVLKPGPGSAIAVFGAGGVGMAAIMAARLAGCSTIVAVDVIADRLQVARDVGATHVIDASATDSVEAVRDITGGGVAYSIECSGRPPVVRQAVDALAPTGTCAIVGAPPFGTTVALDVNGIRALGRTVRGVVEGDAVTSLFLPRLVDHWRAGNLPIERIMRAFDFDAINDAVHQAETGAVIKPVLRLR